MTGIVTGKVGSVVLAVSSGQLVRAELIRKCLPAVSLEPYTTQFEEYLQRKRTTIDLPYRLNCSEFQETVFSAVRKIPYGMTFTYTEVAVMTGTPSAARAVGNALSKNPLHILIPCHRVVASSGIGGFCPGAGTEWKSFLIDLERGAIASEVR